MSSFHGWCVAVIAYAPGREGARYKHIMAPALSFWNGSRAFSEPDDWLIAKSQFSAGEGDQCSLSPALKLGHLTWHIVNPETNEAYKTLAPAKMFSELSIEARRAFQTTGAASKETSQVEQRPTFESTDQLKSPASPRSVVRSAALLTAASKPLKPKQLVS